MVSTTVKILTTLKKVVVEGVVDGEDVDGDEYFYYSKSKG